MPTTLHNLDCLEYLNGDNVPAFDLVVADPPYSSGGMTRGDRMQQTSAKYLQSDSGNRGKLPEFLGDTRDQRGYMLWSWLWMSATMERMKEGGIICVFTDWRQLPTTCDALQVAGFVWRGIVPWWKPLARPQANRYTSACEYVVWGTKGARELKPDAHSRYPEGFFRHRPPVDRVHITEKPVELYRHLYELVQDGGHILDPFVGSANSAVAAEVEARGLNYVGCELSPEIFAAAAKRLELVKAQPFLFDHTTAAAS